MQVGVKCEKLRSEVVVKQGWDFGELVLSGWAVFFKKMNQAASVAIPLAGQGEVESGVRVWC